MSKRPFIADSIDVPMLEALQHGRLESLVLWEPLEKQPEIPPIDGYCAPRHCNLDPTQQVIIKSEWTCTAQRQKQERMAVHAWNGKVMHDVEVVGILRPEKRGRQWGLMFEVRRFLS